MRPHRYQDFGSLVSLGRYSTVGNNLFIKGVFARFVYRSLYRMRLAALHGRTRTLWRSIVGGMGERPSPTVKLH